MVAVISFKKRDDPILATNQNYYPLNFFSIIKGIDLFIKTIILHFFLNNI